MGRISPKPHTETIVFSFRFSFQLSKLFQFFLRCPLLCSLKNHFQACEKNWAAYCRLILNGFKLCYEDYAFLVENRSGLRPLVDSSSSNSRWYSVVFVWYIRLYFINYNNFCNLHIKVMNTSCSKYCRDLQQDLENAKGSLVTLNDNIKRIVGRPVRHAKDSR